MEVNGRLHTPGKNPRYPLDRRLVELQSQSGCCGEEKNLAPAGIRTLAIQSITHCYTDWAVPPPDKDKYKDWLLLARMQVFNLVKVVWRMDIKMKTVKKC
jgi:hypothetical protein